MYSTSLSDWNNFHPCYTWCFIDYCVNLLLRVRTRRLHVLPKGVLKMTLTCIRCWGSGYGTLRTRNTSSIEEIWHPNIFAGLWGKAAVTPWPSADDSSKQELRNTGSRRGRLSFTSLYHEIGMGGPHSRLAMSASAEKQTCDYDWYQRRNHQKSQHVIIFQTREIRQFLCSRQRGRTHNVFPLIPQRMKADKELPLFVGKPRP